MRPRQTCEYCGRSTTNFRRIKDGGGFECLREVKCIAPRRPNAGLLTKMGVAAVVELTERHGGSLRAAARAIGVTRNSLRRYFKLHAPDALAQLRMRLPPMRLGGQKHKITNAAEVTRRLERYDGSIKRAAASLEVHPKTLCKAIRRLVPDVYERLAAGRARSTVVPKRQKPEQHPWRRQWGGRRAA